jgi:hypothetical protein
MEKISITRALAELKLLNDRITKETNNISFVDLYQNRSNKVLKKLIPKEEFEQKVK